MDGSQFGAAPAGDGGNPDAKLIAFCSRLTALNEERAALIKADPTCLDDDGPAKPLNDALVETLRQLSRCIEQLPPPVTAAAAHVLAVACLSEVDRDADGVPLARDFGEYLAMSVIEWFAGRTLTAREANATAIVT